MDLQAAIYARLATGIVGPGLLCQGVHDLAPQQDPAGGWPYVTIDQTILTSVPVDEADTMVALIRVSTWSRVKTLEEVLTIQGDIYAALHGADLPLAAFRGGGTDDWRCVSVLRETGRVMNEADGTWRGLDEYRALIEAT